MRLLILLFLCLSSNFLIAQATTASERISSVADFDKENDQATTRNLSFDNIGPTVFSGRITDLAVDPDDATHFYVAYASGGLWETINNGASFTPIFDHEIVMTIGAIAVDWTNDVIWVGTGEVNSSRSSYAGIGVFKSSDNGKSWEHKGLDESHHIGKIIIHPTNPDIAWVAVLGHLYSYNVERGVYMTSDGGDNWTQSLKVDDHTGAVDMIIDPKDADILYAAMWQRERSAWNFVEAGAGSGIYKSEDGGKTWILAMNGIPNGEGTGRIGLAISSTATDSKIYAFLDNYNRRPKEPKKNDDIIKDELRDLSKQDFAKLDTAKLEKFLRDNRFPKKHNAKSVFKQVAEDDIASNDLVMYLENANSLLFDTPVVGAELYSSENGGASWTKTHEGFMDGVVFSYGYYFAVVSVDPNDADVVYIAGVPILRSEDGGKNFKSIAADNVHVDHHKIWINPASSNHIINGNDGGINISYDAGKHWFKCNTPAVGQFYYINTDEAKPYNVYGGVQDNGVWKGAHTYKESVRWHNTGKYPYDNIMGGDGMQVQIDTRDNETMYTGYQFGNYFRINTKSGDRKYITPQHELGDRPYRWNWQAPIHLSVHNQDILYMGGNRLFRSMHQGEDFKTISEDLTAGGKKGDVPYGTLASVHESSLKFGLIYTGSDDGLIHVTQDGGHQWTKIIATLPKDKWVSRVQASAHQEGRVYASLNGYRSDDFKPYAYVSEDFGKNWKDIASNLPQEPINVIKEDPHHENIIYIGTDRGVYLSIDRGRSYSRFDESLPHVPVHDIVVQASAKDLLIGTHGRSIYRADLEAIYSLVDKGMKELMMMEIGDKRYSSSVGTRRGPYADYRKTEVSYIVYSPIAQAANINIKAGESTISTDTQSLVAGLNYLSYDTTVADNKIEAYKSERKNDAKDVKKADDGKTYLLKGDYTIEVTVGSKSSSQSFKLK